MQNIYNISIVLSFAGLWVTSMFSGNLEIILGFIFIFSFGILHGSNDILLIDSLSSVKLKHPFISVLGIYVLTVLSAVVAFYFIPILALSLFIIFSAFHFGEQHWEYRKVNPSKGITNVFYFIYGMLVLELLFLLNPAEVIEVVEAITTYQLTEAIITYSFIITLTLFLMSSLYLFMTSKVFKKIIFKELFYLLIFTIIFKVSTLIWGFAIYFILWHSIPSLYEQITFIYGDFNKKYLINYCKNALPYWVISLIGISVVYLLFKDKTIFSAVFFSFIAAVTFPHALIINKMFSNKKTQPNT
ncbi:beta-carotene 15,15'-monooxygenase, Brp/Blh family [Formosa sp. Hel1_31_208]|uniref:Brp/Blh family beta-carotene 15,15'-dioxygenase n=1 Tax=Formosa sp. Hel1_31_208 TaxID=1798225 RepID=UPI00087DCE3C|nr:Brp/Blh family beta-carotene 15,15'-dioxygenase [Formosa sp. Hel1_31_208]SDS48836.1 beta-carotene 15,15'-monooxygenase, Brp/Blh family [Formosa sp. Hel1_31_208]